MGTHEIVRIGPIPNLSFQSLPDGSVRTVVEEVPITVKEGDRKILRTERHTFIMVREGRAWKILRVEK